MLRLINENEFEKEVLQADTPVLVDFFATWCGPCKMLIPILEEIATEMTGKAKVFKVDVDQAKSLAQKFNIRGVPTMIIFNKGEMVDRGNGVMPKEDIIDKITAWL
ncbi:MAG: thioredoxin [Defluviitaleaceae bacterium]|nr:thioredoxin [Defluviitaleaceae bacterium]